MKKLVTSFFLTFVLISSICAGETPTFSPNSEIGKWRSFVGVEGGVGIFTEIPAFLVALNSFFTTTQGLGYSVGILGGWQKYKTEKTGFRNTLGFTFSYVPDVTSIRDVTINRICFFCNREPLKVSGERGQVYDFYYAFDGLIDFVKRGKNRFGMSLGFGLNIFGGSSGSGDIFGINWAFLSLRTGLYVQNHRSIFDLSLKLPLAGCGTASFMLGGNTLNLGYKYLF